MTYFIGFLIGFGFASFGKELAKIILGLWNYLSGLNAYKFKIRIGNKLINTESNIRHFTYDQLINIVKGSGIIINEDSDILFGDLKESNACDLDSFNKSGISKIDIKKHKFLSIKEKTNGFVYAGQPTNKSHH